MEIKDNNGQHYNVEGQTVEIFRQILLYRQYFAAHETPVRKIKPCFDYNIYSYVYERICIVILTVFVAHLVVILSVAATKPSLDIVIVNAVFTLIFIVIRVKMEENSIRIHEFCRVFNSIGV